MSFDNIKLPEIVIIDLYKKTLIEAPEIKSRETEKENSKNAILPETLQYLGENEKNIIVMVNYIKEKFLPEQQLDFLTSILTACQCNLKDIAIVNTAHQQEYFNELKEKLKPKCMLLFGTHPASIQGTDEKMHFALTDMNGIIVVKAPELEKLNQNDNEGKLLKSKLWLCLKQLFNV